MAEILITGLEMPKSCLGELDGRNDCPIVGICENFKKTAFNVRVEKSWNQRLENCPLVEVPPHGRLGDLDKMYTETLESFSVWPEHCANDFACFIKDAPTVIEASK